MKIALPAFYFSILDESDKLNYDYAENKYNK